MKKILLAAFASLLPSTALGGTFVVDIQLAPGADFQGVQQALDSPLVTDGDTLLIRPGSYVGVTTSKSITMRGLGASPIHVNFFASSATNSTFKDCAGAVRLTNVAFRGLHFEKCAGPVHLMEIGLNSLAVEEGTFVRMENEVLDELKYFDASILSGSRAEFLHCSLRGKANATTLQGTPGALISGGSFARFADCNITGGSGAGADFPWTLAGDGGVGLDVASGGRALLVGKSGNAIRGGQGGQGLTAQTDGFGGPALSVDTSSTVRVSNFELIGGFTPGFEVQSPDFVGDPSSLNITSLSDPLLTRTGSFAPGATSTFHMAGDPGAMAIAFLGTTVIAAPLPGVAGALATNYSGPFFAGQLDGSAVLSFHINMPASVPIGALATMQSGMVYLSDGSVRLSNPTTIWVQ